MKNDKAPSLKVPQGADNFGFRPEVPGHDLPQPAAPQSDKSFLHKKHDDFFENHLPRFEEHHSRLDSAAYNILIHKLGGPHKSQAGEKKHHGQEHHEQNEWNNFEARTIDGSGNNLSHTDYGTTGSAFITTSGYDYGNGYSTPNDADRPNVREISNEIFAQNGDIFNASGISNFLWVWGQFLDHDINLTEGGTEEYDITVPQGDIYFDPYNTGTQVIDFTRSGYAEGTGTDTDNPRLQVNDITAFIDASNIYGSTAEKQAELRGEGGKLLTSEGNLLPIVMGDHGPEFLSGDERVNENVALTSMHTLFTREHNFWVDKIAAEHPELTGDELYERAKAIVEAEIQHVTFDEFLPALLGDDAIGKYKGYDATINPQIATEFATAAFRVGHTMLSSDIFRMQEDGAESSYGDMTLQQAFFRPDMIMSQGGIDEILRGMGSSYSQSIDAQIIDDVRNFLFGPPGAGGFDLVSLNIQRGRDHGLPDFNSVREAYGLDPVNSFEDLTGNTDLAAKLTALYGDISHLDLWVGGLIESPYGQSLVGETFYTIIADQFTRLRDGDRFWYEDRLDSDLVDMVKDTSLSDIIMRNTDLICLQEDIFSAKMRQGGDDSDNHLIGTDQDDLLIGFGGNDILNGGKGDDVYYGGEGHDIFVFDKLSDGYDIVRDFDPTQDKIDISDILEGCDDCHGAIKNFIVATETDKGLEIAVSDPSSHGASNPAAVVLLEGVHSDNPLDFIITNSQDIA